MKASGQRTLTLAPEVATEKLATMTGKRIGADVLIRAVEEALAHDIINCRLYFIIGFPGEDEDDVRAIVDLAGRVHKVMIRAARTLRKMGTLTLSVNPFVPKPFTPLELAPFTDTALLSARIKILRQGIARIANTRLTMESPRMAGLQCMFSRGDRRVGRVVELLAEGMTASQAAKVLGKSGGRYLCPAPESSAMRPWHIVCPPARYPNKNKGEMRP
jgi:radical SAM superfamily enzyme YgiQ (UPF0313 family)